MKTIARHAFGLVLGPAMAGALAGSAFAHAKLVSADPADGAVVKAGLTTLRLAFSEDIAGKLSGASVTDAAGKTVATAAAVVDPANAKALLVATKAPLKAGLYKVAWRAVASDDGHKTTGGYSFTIK